MYRIIFCKSFNTHSVDHIRKLYRHLCDDVCVDDVNVFGCLAYEHLRKLYALDGLQKNGECVQR